MPNIIPVPEPSRNLWTLDRSLYEDEAVRFVAAQGIRGEGAIVAHDHGEENLVELIYLAEGAVYGGLEDPRIVKTDRSTVVPIGVPHGDLDKASRGQWLSVKVDGYAHYLANPQVSGSGVAHMFETEDERLLRIVFADNVSDLYPLLMPQVSGSEASRRTSLKIFGLPLVDLHDLPSVYKESHKAQAQRYLAIRWSR